MYDLRSFGLLTVMPVTILLTISLFVLLIIRKVDGHGLKIFSYVIVALLWLTAIIIFSTGIYALSSGQNMMNPPMGPPMKPMMHQRMDRPPRYNPPVDEQRIEPPAMDGRRQEPPMGEQREEPPRNR